MKIEQKQANFDPITITLETKEEAQELWDAVNEASNNEVSMAISNAFSEQLEVPN